MTLTDEMLRAEMQQGLKPAQIAAKYGLSRQAVHQRVKRLALTTTAVAVVAPVESRRFVNTSIDILEELAASLSRVKLLMDACDAWLRDVDDPSQYDVGPRGEEVLVTVELFDPETERQYKEKRSLSEWIRRLERHENTEGAEFRHADPRELILKTAQEVRQTVQAGHDMALKLADARAMTALREAILTEIGKVDPDCAQRIAEAVRRLLILHTASE